MVLDPDAGKQWVRGAAVNGKASWNESLIERPLVFEIDRAGRTARIPSQSVAREPLHSDARFEHGREYRVALAGGGDQHRCEGLRLQLVEPRLVVRRRQSMNSKPRRTGTLLPHRRISSVLRHARNAQRRRSKTMGRQLINFCLMHGRCQAVVCDEDGHELRTLEVAAAGWRPGSRARHDSRTRARNTSVIG